MEFIPIYLLILAAFASAAALLILKTTGRESKLPTTTTDMVQDYLAKLRHNLERSRTGITVEEYFIMKFGIPALMAFMAYFLSDNYSLMLVLILMGFMLPDMIIMLKKGSENKKFESRFIRALAQMAAGLHSGMTVEQAIDSVITCELLHEHIREDFKILSAKMKLGIPISDAFYQFAEMTESNDAKDVATAITIMTEVGGDAGTAIEKIQKNIENRLLYRKKRESMMTESKLIALVADVMPIIILVGTYIFMPGTIESYFESTTMTLIFIVIIGILLVGSLVVHRMLKNKIDAS